MARRLSTTVHVHGPDGQSRSFGPGDDVPEWVEAAIANPDVWAAPPPASEPAELNEPPRAGKGSSREAWADYATRVGVELGEDATRDEIIAAVGR